jgi:iron-sulfur cluster repair protein YtfE (RIC family)
MPAHEGQAWSSDKDVPMRRTEKLRRQHNELGQLVALLRGELTLDRLVRDAAPARGLLSRLLDKLSVHLATEDRLLYPELRRHPEAAVADRVADLEHAMLAISDAIVAFGKRWPTPSVIADRPAIFIIETQEMLEALVTRIQLEESELYPAADALPGDAFPVIPPLHPDKVRRESQP